MESKVDIFRIQGIEFLEWRPWFAWYPVKQYSTGKWLWLKKLYRRKCYFNYEVVVPTAAPIYIKQQLLQFIFETRENVLCDNLAGTKYSKLEQILKSSTLKNETHKTFFID